MSERLKLPRPIELAKSMRELPYARKKRIAQYPKFTIRASHGKATATSPGRILDMKYS